jgi:hypothetical protein
MVVEYGVVIRRQVSRKDFNWQLWTGAGKIEEDASFLAVMNRAGAMGFEAVAAGHFDELQVPEVLLQRKMEDPPAATAVLGLPEIALVPALAAKPPARLAAKPAKPPAKKKPTAAGKS